MKLSTLAATASALALTMGFAASAQAQDTSAPAVTAEIGLVGAHNSNDDVDTNLAGVQLRAGYQFHKNFGVEIEGAVGIGDDSVQVAPATYVTVKERYEVGAFAVGYLPLSDSVDVLGRVGYAQNSIKASSGAVSTTQENNGAAVGVGLRIFPEGDGQKDGVRFDYTHYFFNNDADSDTLSVAWVHKF